MGSDFFFRMGSTHAVCQDYAIAGGSDRMSYAMLSDGCSGRPIPGEPGSPYTDFGARFLVRSAQRHLSPLMAGHFPGTAILHDAQAIAHQARLPTVAMDATLLIATARENGPVTVYHSGDGVIAARKRDGTRHYCSLEFGNGMPYYLSYQLSTSRKDSFFNPPPELSISPEEVGKVFITNGVKAPGGAWDQTHSSHKIDPQAPCHATSYYDRDAYDLVLLLSDGASSFQLKDGTPVPLEDVLDQLLEVKGFAGQFLTRRCSRFLQAFCVERGWQHSDDFSVAGICLGASP